MPNLTLAQMRARIQVLVPDNAIAAADLTSVIQTAHELFPMEFFVDHVDETSITLATDTWEYTLPETSNVSTFVRIHEVRMESETAGLFDTVIPMHLFQLTYDGSGVWQIVFDRRFEPISGRKLRISGQKRYSTPSGDSDVVTLHNGWVIAYATALIHAAQGGTTSDMANWHQRMAGQFFENAERMVDNINNRAKPGSVSVPGVI